MFKTLKLFAIVATVFGVSTMIQAQEKTEAAPRKIQNALIVGSASYTPMYAHFLTGMEVHFF